MKAKITLLSLAFCALSAQAQTISDFESFTLAPNSAYSPSTSAPFQTSSAIFQYEWTSSFGGFWSGGFAYTNKQDSGTAGFSNLYGVRALKGYSNSANYVVGQAGGVIHLKAPYDKVDGFYITNTTYAYKAIKNGDSFSRQFGDTTGTGSGTTIAQGAYPDFFKITAKGYKNGVLKSDSVEFYLADYRFANSAQDYIVNSWQWFNTSSLGSIDSLTFFMYSSDVGQFGMNTPAFFALDNFSASAPNPVGVRESLSAAWQVWPNPFNDFIRVSGPGSLSPVVASIKDLSGRAISKVTVTGNNATVDVASLAPGIYFFELDFGTEKVLKRLVKN